VETSPARCRKTRGQTNAGAPLTQPHPHLYSYDPPKRHSRSTARPPPLLTATISTATAKMNPPARPATIAAETNATPTPQALLSTPPLPSTQGGTVLPPPPSSSAERGGGKEPNKQRGRRRRKGKKKKNNDSGAAEPPDARQAPAEVKGGSRASVGEAEEEDDDDDGGEGDSGCDRMSGRNRKAGPKTRSRARAERPQQRQQRRRRRGGDDGEEGEDEDRERRCGRKSPQSRGEGEDGNGDGHDNDEDDDDGGEGGGDIWASLVARRRHGSVRCDWLGHEDARKPTSRRRGRRGCDEEEEKEEEEEEEEEDGEERGGRRRRGGGRDDAEDEDAEMSTSDDGFPARFLRLKRLGTGTYGEVYAVIDNHNPPSINPDAPVAETVGRSTLALKVQTEEENDVGPFLREVNALMAMQPHPNVVRVLEVSIGEGARWILMQRCAIDLRRFLKSAPRHQRLRSARSIAYQVASAMAYGHAMGLAHRDLKPSNVLLDVSTRTGKVTARLCDYGLSKDLRGLYHSPDVCALAYRAPELLAGSRVYDDKVDVWSYGVILAELLNGRDPLPKTYTDHDALAALRHMAEKGGARALLAKKKVTPQTLGLPLGHAIDVAHAALSLDPRDRPSFEAILRGELFAGIESVRPCFRAAGGAKPIAPRMTEFSRGIYEKALRRIARAIEREDMMKITFVAAADMMDAHLGGEPGQGADGAAREMTPPPSPPLPYPLPRRYRGMPAFCLADRFAGPPPQTSPRRSPSGSPMSSSSSSSPSPPQPPPGAAVAPLGEAGVEADPAAGAGGGCGAMVSWRGEGAGDDEEGYEYDEDDDDRAYTPPFRYQREDECMTLLAASCLYLAVNYYEQKSIKPAYVSAIMGDEIDEEDIETTALDVLRRRQFCMLSGHELCVAGDKLPGRSWRHVVDRVLEAKGIRSPRL
jgi:serine/threonine protein kinase